MDNLTLSAIIKNNIGLKNLEGSRDIVIYNNDSGANSIEDIALEMGATYEMFITSAADSNDSTQYGQQKVTIKLIPAEDTPNNYDLYMTVTFYEISATISSPTYIHIHKYNTELWDVSITIPFIKIYQIIKKAV